MWRSALSLSDLPHPLLCFSSVSGVITSRARRSACVITAPRSLYQVLVAFLRHIIQSVVQSRCGTLLDFIILHNITANLNFHVAAQICFGINREADVNLILSELTLVASHCKNLIIALYLEYLSYMRVKT